MERVPPFGAVAGSQEAKGCLEITGKGACRHLLLSGRSLSEAGGEGNLRYLVLVLAATPRAGRAPGGTHQGGSTVRGLST